MTGGSRNDRAVRLRFAPSPNGRLHLGHAYSALLNDRVARKLGGQWLLRIEDIDPARSSPANIAAIETDLAWLGLSWPAPARRQSQHLDLYAEAADRLRAQGVLYACFCTRGEIAEAVARRERESGRPWPRDPDGAPRYPGTCRCYPPGDVARRIAVGAPHGWRLALDAALHGIDRVEWTRFDPDADCGGENRVVRARPADWGDALVVRKDVPTSYHLGVVVDDVAQRITHVVRGRDLERATDLHALLAARLGLATPCYHHHSLITGMDGLKLAKSRTSPSLAALRENGESAASICARLGF